MRSLRGIHLGNSIASPIASRDRDPVAVDVNGNVHRGSTQQMQAVASCTERRERRVVRASGSG